MKGIPLKILLVKVAVWGVFQFGCGASQAGISQDGKYLFGA